MAPQDDTNYNLNIGDLEEKIKLKGIKWQKTLKILIISFICINLAITVALIIFISLHKKHSNKNKEFNRKQTNNETKIKYVYNFLGVKYSNLNYGVDDKIENTFKKNGDNYNESMGEINNRKDYEINDRNIYDLYII